MFTLRAHLGRPGTSPGHLPEMPVAVLEPGKEESAGKNLDYLYPRRSPGISGGDIKENKLNLNLYNICIKIKNKGAN